jgi:hypothetical protein
MKPAANPVAQIHIEIMQVAAIGFNPATRRRA